jgi:hypothetical protein
MCDAGRRRRTRCTRMRGDGLEQKIYSEMEKQDDGGTHERKTRGGGDTVKRTQQREKHSSQVNGRAIANAGVRGAGDVTPAPPAAADARRRRARAPPRDPESPKKAAPQDLFTTPGYHDPHPPVVWGMCGAAPREYVEPPVIPHVVSRTQCGNHGS